MKWRGKRRDTRLSLLGHLSPATFVEASSAGEVNARAGLSGSVPTSSRPVGARKSQWVELSSSRLLKVASSATRVTICCCCCCCSSPQLATWTSEQLNNWIMFDRAPKSAWTAKEAAQVSPKVSLFDLRDNKRREETKHHLSATVCCARFLIFYTQAQIEYLKMICTLVCFDFPLVKVEVEVKVRAEIESKPNTLFSSTINSLLKSWTKETVNLLEQIDSFSLLAGHD